MTNNMFFFLKIKLYIDKVMQCWPDLRFGDEGGGSVIWGLTLIYIFFKNFRAKVNVSLDCAYYNPLSSLLFAF